MMIGTAMSKLDGAAAGGVWTGRAAELISSASIEISPRDHQVQDGLCGLLPSGATVFVNHPGSVTHHDVVAVCLELRRAGFTPIPHLVARRLVSFTQARDFLQRAVGEAAVTSVLLTGGDPAQPVGPFYDTADLLATGLVESHGIANVVLAGHPEGHPRIDRRSLYAQLRTKLTAAQQRGLNVSLVTQFVFEPGPVQDWVSLLREEGVGCPIRIGVAGPATIATLAKFAVRCGIGASLQAIGRGEAAFARILAEATSDALICSLATTRDGGVAFDGLHVFTFGGARRAAEWMRARREGFPLPAPQ
jgi:methylenetetrahydrofolate reductase (NADPH)